MTEKKIKYIGPTVGSDELVDYELVTSGNVTDKYPSFSKECNCGECKCKEKR